MSDKWDWQVELGKAHLIDRDIAEFIGINKTAFSQLRKKMIEGKGLAATELDRSRWDKTLDYIEIHKKKHSKI